MCNTIQWSISQFKTNIIIYHFKQFSIFIDTQICDTLKGDERSIPGPLNYDTTGSNINIFSSITVPVSGRVKHVLFYARRSRKVYVSFWKPTGVQHEFEMETKIEINNQEEGHVVRIIHKQLPDILSNSICLETNK